ncbi:winged helix-turn-helix transcriptional regulator [Polynucleobacter sp. Ross1-W9]|uniref:winged helix-turn-helix domain-containing protein n=1 Tax=Polynucleobacter parvulilacunae TaxID=1855631 RepID=UPI001C0CB493|nr:winged helix-turn-helix domain-containing protein [Polynucleobacter parvulilacunae]MBU3557365.1 winged helix-turn-helix transcriptional regulator [Polynucleobacter parvulilacunae]
MRNSLSVFEALGNETRFKVFDFIYQSGKLGARPKDMIDEFGFDSGTLDFHLKKLASSKLICLKAGGRRGVYCICENIPQWLMQAFESTHIVHELLIGERASSSASKAGALH